MADGELIRGLRKALGPENVLSAPSELAVYDCDAFTVERRPPAAVVFPRSSEQVAEVVRICADVGCPIVPRGAGTGLAGGCSPLAGGVVLMLTRMNRILEIRLRDSLALVEPGVLNLQLTQALAGTGYHFAPDPSSQSASTIGGNVATNAGGPHTLKYGVTANHVAGLEVVLADGSVVEFGPVKDPAALDLARVVCGSEGTLAIVTKIWARLTRLPEGYRTIRATFASIEDASQAVSQIIAAGIVPAALELMDRGILEAVEDAFPEVLRSGKGDGPVLAETKTGTVPSGAPREAAALLVIELDGAEAGLDALLEQVIAICRDRRATGILQAKTGAERELLWKCRKMAVGAVGRLSPCYVLQDGVVPRTLLPRIFQRMQEIAAEYKVRIVNVAHAGDGNVHPIFLLDPRDGELVQRVKAAGRAALEECIACGGSITAEHGVGVEKIALMKRLFSPADLRAMHRVREAFDPAGVMNPGKKLPPCARSTGLSPNALVQPPEGDTASNAAPTDEAAVASVVSQAFKCRRAVYPVGGGTSLNSGLPRPKAGIMLSLAALNRVLDYPADDLTVTVEAGITLSELNRRLAEKGQWLPIDAPEPAKATIGGIIATNASGPRRQAYGTIGDYLIGFRAIDGRGEPYGGGGKVVKNAAGYNLPRLLVGSLGTLGVITQATFMVRPLPACSAIVLCDVPRCEQAECLLAGLGRSQAMPAIVELLAGPARPNCPLPLVPCGAAARLAIGFEGSSPDVQAMIDTLCNEWRASAIGGVTTIAGAGVASIVNWLGASPAAMQVNVLPSRLVGLVDQFASLLPDYPLQAHAGCGELRVYAPSESSSALAERLPKLVRDKLRPLVTTAGGYLTVLATREGCELTAADAWGPPRAGAALIKTIQQRFDPASLLNPI